jgi:hypothetical protein
MGEPRLLVPPSKLHRLIPLAQLSPLPKPSGLLLLLRRLGPDAVRSPD